MKIGELLVQNNLISVTQLEQALQAQKIFGGKLGTNLVEMGFINQHDLTKFLAKQLNLPAASAVDFEQIPKEVIALVEADYAKEHMLIPLKIEGSALSVAFADPLDLDTRKDLEFRIGMKINPSVAPEILINYALDKHYRVHREARYIPIAAEQGNELELERNLNIDEITSPEKVVSDAFSNYPFHQLTKDLASAPNNDAVFKALLRYLEPVFDQLAVFVVRGQDLWGWTSQGFPMPTADFRKKLFPLTTPSILTDALKSRDLAINANLRQADQKVLQSLGGDLNHGYHVFPILLGPRPISALLASSHEVANEQAISQRMVSIQEALSRASLGIQLVGLRTKLLKPTNVTDLT